MIKRILCLLLITSTSSALELQTKPRNSDKRYFNAMPNVKANEGLRFYSEFNYSTNPLVGKGSLTNEVKPLIDTQMELDLSLTYGLSENVQVGILLPVESNKQTYLGSTVLEGKWNFMKGLAFVPQYYLPSSQVVNITTDNGQVLEIPLGAPKGGFGAKIVGEWGDISKDGAVGAFVGYVSQPENVYGTLDQTTRIQMGVSGGIPVTKTSNFILELFGEKTPSNMPMEAQALFNSYGKSWSYSVGVGSGKLKGTAGNDVKAFFGLAYTFGKSEKKGYFPTLPTSSGNPVDWKRFDTKKNQGTFNEDDIEESTGPAVEDPKAPEVPFDRNSLDKSEEFLKGNTRQNIDRQNIPDAAPTPSED